MEINFFLLEWCVEQRGQKTLNFIPERKINRPATSVFGGVMNMNKKTRKSFKSAVNSFFSRLEHTGTMIKEVETTPKSFGRW